jgi:Flp pilus assembly pilin Flp
MERAAMIRAAKQFIADESGATVIEYGVVAILISVVALVALNSISGSVGELYAMFAGGF